MLPRDFGLFDGKIMTEIDGGGIAEIIINSSAKPISADTLVRVMTMNGITAARITRTTQPAKESPLSAVCDPTGERAAHR
jgi:hypothetical protein